MDSQYLPVQSSLFLPVSPRIELLTAVTLRLLEEDEVGIAA